MLENNNKIDLDVILGDYIDRCIIIIEGNHALGWIPLCSEFSKLSKEDDTKEYKNRKNKNKNDVFYNFINEIHNSMPFFKILKILGKVIKNPDEFKEGKGNQKLLDIEISLKKIEDSVKSISKTKKKEIRWLV